MDCYLVYEFVYHNSDNDTDEEVEFFGLYKSRRDAVKKALKRIDYGIENYNVVLSPDDSKKKNVFWGNNLAEMYRDDDEFEMPVYSICIKKFRVKERGKNE